MSPITHVGRILVPVADQDAAIVFYTQKLGFELTADTPFGNGDRWVEVTPSGGGTALALAPTQGDFQAGRMTGIAFDTTDASGTREELQAKGVDVDASTMGGDGTVPALFFFRDHDANSLMVVERV